MGESTMNKKCCSVVSTLLFMCCVFTGCGGGGSNNDSDMIQRNIYKEDYDEQYNHYEDEVYVAKKCSKITVDGSATSGTIDLKIVEKDGDKEENTYTYTIEDSLSETIELEKKHSTDWVVIVDFNEESEGTYTVQAVQEN